MPGKPVVITGGTGIANIQQVRRKKDIGRLQRSKRSKRTGNALKRVGAL